MSEELIGYVTHWYSSIGVAGVHLDRGRLRVGDTIHVLGRTSDVTGHIDSMEIAHEAVREAASGDDVGVRMPDHVREHDKVYLVH